MKTIAEILSISSAFLSERAIERPRRSAEELLSSVLGVKRMDLYLQHDRPLIESELDAIRPLLKRRASGEPLEHILGECEFFQCRLALSSDVLIPRQETEILVDLVAKKLSGNPNSGRILWDLCTGSGCIGLSLKKAFPEISVTLSDICPNALAIAKKNAQTNGLNVEFRQGNLLEPFIGEKADLILCNPPYISQKEYEALDPGVRDFEPRQALLAGERGTEFYERMAAEMLPFLRAGAQVFFEIGASQGEAVQRIFAEFPCSQRCLIKDWAGKDRFFFLEIE